MNLYLVGNFLGIDFLYVIVENNLEKEMYLENVEYKWCVHVSKYIDVLCIFCK